MKDHARRDDGIVHQVFNVNVDGVGVMIAFPEACLGELFVQERLRFSVKRLT